MASSNCNHCAVRRDRIGGAEHVDQVTGPASHAPTGGILSEGDKRDSKGVMSESIPHLDCHPTTFMTLKGSRSGGPMTEATLLRSQRLGLGRGVSIRKQIYHLLSQRLCEVGARYAPSGLAGRVSSGAVVAYMSRCPQARYSLPLIVLVPGLPT